MRPKTTVLLLVVALMWAMAVPSATAQEAPEFSPEQIVFPVVGDVYFTDTFGAPRAVDRTHEGIDIMSVDGVKGRPVVAAADGVVDWIGSTCCYLSIDHGGGWETWYIHLNNDTPGTDDGLGWGIADGIEVGTPVSQGQLIGWVGDSGNAEEAGAHLHFEIRTEGVAINGYPYLVDAPRLDEPGGSVYSFRDTYGSVHAENIEIIYAQGITRGCNPPDNDRYCPYDTLSRGHVAAFLRRLLELPNTENDYFGDDTDSIFQGDINALTEAGVAFGCTETEFCAAEPLSRAEMAEFLVRAFGYEVPEDVDSFVDDDGNPFEASIEALYAAGITVGCSVDDPTVYCPDDSLTRAQMATFLARALGLGS